MKPRWIILLCLCVLFPGVSFPPAPTPPVITAVPQRGAPRQMIKIVGAPTSVSGLLWDTSPLTFTSQPNGSTKDISFQIPDNAPLGPHQAELRDLSGRSLGAVTIDVGATPSMLPVPRIEDIGISGLQAQSGVATIQLTVSAANVDPSSVIEVNTHTLTTVLISTISGSFLDPDPALVGVLSSPPGNARPNPPIYHFGLISASLVNQPLGATITVKVINSNGASDSRDYFIPTLDKLDSDGDGLLDDWETKGYPLPNGSKIDLKAMGCNPYRKDVLVEVDWMKSAQPDPGIFDIIEKTFANDAPVLNPDGSRGISLHIDRGQGNGPFTGGGTILPDYETMDFCTDPGAPFNATFSDLKRLGFNPDRLGIFHYCIFGCAQLGMSTGSGEIWGDDFYVTLTMMPDWIHNTDAQIGTFVHELGHNLGLRHGGIDNGAQDEDLKRKPNQESVMNYRYQWSGLPVTNPGGRFTYSIGRNNTIYENLIHMDVNGDGDKTGVLVDYDEWGHLEMDFKNPKSRSSQDSIPCCVNITLCATVIWDIHVTSIPPIPPSSTTQLWRRADNLTIEHGLCYPPAGCGDTIACIPPGFYVPSVLMDTSRFYLTGLPGDTLRIPNNLAGVDSVQVLAGDTVRIKMIIAR